MTPQELAGWLKKQDIRQGDLAVYLHVNASTVSRWLDGHSPIPHSVELALKNYPE